MSKIMQALNEKIKGVTIVRTYLEDWKQIELKSYKKETWAWGKERWELKCSKVLELFRIRSLL